jgi:cobalt-precorrin 5A hydrolase
MSELAVVALTPHGLELGRRIAAALGRGEVFDVHEGTRDKLQELFEAGRPLVCIMALGIVVRLLGPLARHKETDPPVVVIDEAGQFAISVLGGHAGGANVLTKQVARALGALPIITTASDALGLPPIDLIGRDWGWKIERPENLKRVAAAAIRGELIGVYQDAGRQDWWAMFGDWPATFQRIKCWPAQGYWAGLLFISDLELCALERYPAVVYRPPTLVLGVGCRRGVPCSDFEAMFSDICRSQGFSPLSIGQIATVSLKADEPGLLEFAALHGVPVRSFRVEELAAVDNLPNPSERVRAKIGIPGVAEPAAMLASGSKTLVVEKQKGERITMALARREGA